MTRGQQVANLPLPFPPERESRACLPAVLVSQPQAQPREVVVDEASGAPGSAPFSAARQARAGRAVCVSVSVSVGWTDLQRPALIAAILPCA